MMKATLKTVLTQLGLDQQQLTPEQIDTLTSMTFDEQNVIKKLNKASAEQPAAWGVFGSLICF